MCFFQTNQRQLDQGYPRGGHNRSRGVHRTKLVSIKQVSAGHETKSKMKCRETFKNDPRWHKQRYERVIYRFVLSRWADTAFWCFFERTQTFQKCRRCETEPYEADNLIPECRLLNRGGGGTIIPGYHLLTVTHRGFKQTNVASYMDNEK